MRLPRRVPWSSTAELEQVCAWIFTDDSDIPSKVLAINRLSAWKVITPLPHALESTLALLAVILHDRTNSAQSLNQLSLRQSYAAAVIRLVNGLVDPLQLGAYARSIASIAAQLGLPGWLVELRHAATHEDLPSLELLREAARQSMEWLFHNYFLPTVNLASVPQREAPQLRPLAPILKQYKAILKTIIRDASLRTRYKREVNTITRDIERWIAEAKVAASVVIGEGVWNPGGDTPGEPLVRIGDNSVDSKEKWALEQLCGALLEKGGLVPLSKKKRKFPDDKFWPPQLSVSLWTPLLKHIQILHPDFAYILCTCIIHALLTTEDSLAPTPAPDCSSVTSIQAKNDTSYEMCLARWVVWAADTWSGSNAELDNTGTRDGMNADLRKDVAVSLMQGLGHRLGDDRIKDHRVTQALLQSLCQQNASCQAALEFLTQSSNQLLAAEWTEQDITTMSDRLTILLSSKTGSDHIATSKPISLPAPAQVADDHSVNVDAIAEEAMLVETEIDTKIDIDIPGWRRLDVTGWKPCPIGVFHKA